MIESAFPILSTPDLARALGFYEELLGGTVIYRFPDDGDARYVGLDLGSSHLGIGAEPDLDAESATQRFALWVYVNDCDALIETSRAAGVTILEEPVDQPWGERVARVADPDGNIVIIGARGEMASDG
ncbi:MAG TPA: VOC family protein [Acidimicrobiia bacterium]|jgi:lactoylglutathione lyase|nr:VOC family protein [Acidimicrobiia bacterium]